MPIAFFSSSPRGCWSSANGVTSVSVEVEDGADGAGHDTEGADRVRQAPTGFADGLPFLMRVDTAAGGPVQVQGTVLGQRLSLTATLFLELLDAQGEPGFFPAWGGGGGQCLPCWCSRCRRWAG